MTVLASKRIECTLLLCELGVKAKMQVNVSLQLLKSIDLSGKNEAPSGKPSLLHPQIGKVSTVFPSSRGSPRNEFLQLIKKVDRVERIKISSKLFLLHQQVGNQYDFPFITRFSKKMSCLILTLVHRGLKQIAFHSIGTCLRDYPLLKPDNVSSYSLTGMEQGKEGQQINTPGVSVLYRYSDSCLTT